MANQFKSKKNICFPLRDLQSTATEKQGKLCGSRVTLVLSTLVWSLWCLRSFLRCTTIWTTCLRMGTVCYKNVINKTDNSPCDVCVTEFVRDQAVGTGRHTHTGTGKQGLTETDQGAKTTHNHRGAYVHTALIHPHTTHIPLPRTNIPDTHTYTHAHTHAPGAGKLPSVRPPI